MMLKRATGGPSQHLSRSDIAHLHIYMRIVEIKRVGQSDGILPTHVKEEG